MWLGAESCDVKMADNDVIITSRHGGRETAVASDNDLIEITFIKEPCWTPAGSVLIEKSTVWTGQTK